MVSLKEAHGAVTLEDLGIDMCVRIHMMVPMGALRAAPTEEMAPLLAHTAPVADDVHGVVAPAQLLGVLVEPVALRRVVRRQQVEVAPGVQAQQRPGARVQVALHLHT